MSILLEPILVAEGDDYKVWDYWERLYPYPRYDVRVDKGDKSAEFRLHKFPCDEFEEILADARDRLL